MIVHLELCDQFYMETGIDGNEYNSSIELAEVPRQGEFFCFTDDRYGFCYTFLIEEVCWNYDENELPAQSVDIKLCMVHDEENE